VSDAGTMSAIHTFQAPLPDASPLGKSVSPWERGHLWWTGNMKDLTDEIALAGTIVCASARVAGSSGFGDTRPIFHPASASNGLTTIDY
jgi:hypothetical protein